MVEFGLDRTALRELKGNITFYNRVRVYEHDYKYTEFHNVLVKIKEEGLIFTYKKNGEFVDYTYPYNKLWRIEAEDKRDFSVDKLDVLNPRFECVHVLPSDVYYVVDAQHKWFDDKSFKPLPYFDKEVVEDLVEKLNEMNDKINILNGLYQLDKNCDGDVKNIEL